MRKLRLLPSLSFRAQSERLLVWISRSLGILLILQISTLFCASSGAQENETSKAFEFFCAGKCDARFETSIAEYLLRRAHADTLSGVTKRFGAAKMIVEYDTFKQGTGIQIFSMELGDGPTRLLFRNSAAILSGCYEVREAKSEKGPLLLMRFGARNFTSLDQNFAKCIDVLLGGSE